MRSPRLGAIIEIEKQITVHQKYEFRKKPICRNCMINHQNEMNGGAISRLKTKSLNCAFHKCHGNSADSAWSRERTGREEGTQDLFTFETGSRPVIQDAGPGSGAPVYTYYGAAEMNRDLSCGVEEIEAKDQKQVRTFQELPLFRKGDIALSLTNPRAAVISDASDGMLHTSNYLKIIPSDRLDPAYFVFLINEDAEVRKILLRDREMSTIARASLQGVRELQKLKIPCLDEQKRIGEAYFSQLKLSALQKKRSELQELYTFTALRRKLHDNC